MTAGEQNDPPAEAPARSSLDLPEEPEGSMSRHAVSGAFWTVVQSWGGRLMSMLIFVMLGRLLAPKDFGLVALAMVLVDLGNMLTAGGFHRAIVQRRTLDPEHLDAAFWSMTAVGVGLCLAIVASADLVAELFGEPGFANILRVQSIMFVLSALGAVPSAILQRRMAFKAFALRQLAATVSGGAVGVALAALGAGAWALVAQTLSAASVGLVVIAASARWWPRLHFSRRHWRELVGFGVMTLAIEIFDVVESRLDDLLIGVALGPAALGYYGVAYRTYAIAQEVVGHSLNNVVFPIFSRIVHDRERMDRAVVTTIRLSACLTLPVFLGMAALADYALLGLFGDKWGPSVTVLRILSVCAAVTGGVMFSREVVLAAGRTARELGSMAIGAVAICIAFLIGVQWGLVGVAWGRLAVAFVVVLLGLLAMRAATSLDIRRYLTAWIRPIPACLTMVAAVLLVKRVSHLHPGSLGALAVMGLIGGVVYAGALTVTAPATVREIVGKVRRRDAGT